MTLWRLPETIEEEFEGKWEHWLDRANEWQPFFLRLESLQENDLKIALHSFDAVTNHELEMYSHFVARPEGVQCPYLKHSLAPIKISRCSPLDSHAGKPVHSWFLTLAEEPRELAYPFSHGFFVNLS